MAKLTKFVKTQDISNEIKNTSDSERLAYSLQEALIKANKFINQQSEEIQHLKKLLNDAIPSSSVLLPSDEEVIADMQLARLKTAAIERTLSLDECRALDLLVKTKRIAKDAASEIIDHKGLPKTLTQTELVKIAVRKPKA